MGFIKEFMEVQAHGNTKLHVIHTNDLHKADTTIEQYERHLEFERHKIVGVDVEYTNDVGEDKKPALVQLSVGMDHSVLLFQLSAADKNCTRFDNFLADPRYTFAGFSIDGDIEMLGHVDWRSPTSSTSRRNGGCLQLPSPWTRLAMSQASLSTTTTRT